jgi:hypothetical protein
MKLELVSLDESSELLENESINYGSLLFDSRLGRMLRDRQIAFCTVKGFRFLQGHIHL